MGYYFNPRESTAYHPKGRIPSLISLMEIAKAHISDKKLIFWFGSEYSGA